MLHDQFLAAYSAGDLDRVMAFYADDAVQMAPNVPAFVSKDVIRSVYEEVLRIQRTELSYVIDEVEVAEDLAFLRTTYVDTRTPTLGGEPARTGGHSLTILRRTPDGSWKIWREMWTHVRPRVVDELLRKN